MANRFMNIFKKPDRDTVPENPVPKPPVRKDPDRLTRQRTMLDRLSGIDLKGPQNKLSEETIQELKIPDVIRFAYGRLSDDNPTVPDAPDLDRNIAYIIDALHDAIRQGFAETAQWACTALIYHVRELRIEIPSVDLEYADALMAARLEYSHNLRMLVTLSRDHDGLYSLLNEQHRRRDAQQAELDRRKADLAARRDSGTLDAANLKTELDELRLLEKSVAELQRFIESNRQRLSQCKSQIDSCRNILATPPHVCDPKLQEQVNESNRRYREQLRKKLDYVDETKLSRERHLENLEMLLGRDGTPATPSASPEKPRTKPVRQGPNRQTRQQQMRSRLESIDLDSPRNRLSHDQIQELRIADVIRLARETLSADNPAIADDPVLDRNILRIIHLLEDALVQGYENTAQWACTALYHAFQNLRTKIPEASKAYVDILMEQRTAYADNLRLLVELYREHDHVSGILDPLNRRREGIRLEFESKKKHFQSRRNHGILDKPLAELEAKAHDPTALSEEALALLEDLDILHKLKSTLNAIDADINTNQLLQIQLAAQIETLRIVLANPPHACNPKLREQVDEAEVRYVRQLLSGAKPDDHDALLAENVLLRNQVKALQDQVETCQCEPASFKHQLAFYRYRIGDLEREVKSLKNQLNSQQESVNSFQQPQKPTFDDLLEVDDL